MDRIRYATYRTKTKRMQNRMQYRHRSHQKTPGLVFFQQVLTKGDFSESLWTQFGLLRKRLNLAECATDTEVIMKQVV